MAEINSNEKLIEKKLIISKAEGLEPLSFVPGTNYFVLDGDFRTLLSTANKVMIDTKEYTVLNVSLDTYQNSVVSVSETLSSCPLVIIPSLSEIEILNVGGNTYELFEYFLGISEGSYDLALQMIFDKGDTSYISRDVYACNENFSLSVFFNYNVYLRVFNFSNLDFGKISFRARARKKEKLSQSSLSVVSQVENVNADQINDNYGKSIRYDANWA